MLKRRFATLSAVAILTTASSLSAVGQDQRKAVNRPTQHAALSEHEAYAIAKDAYVYAYPLMLTYATLQRLSNFAEPRQGDTFGPPNQMHHARAFPNPDDKIVIRENVDTLYSAATIDLKAEPMVLSVPATDRYFLLPMLSLWSDVFAVPGTRTTGKNAARSFLVVGPRWRGAAPAELEVIRSPTRYVWIIGRTQTNGAADYANVHKVQDGFRLTPLSAWGRGAYVPPRGKVDPTIDMKTPPPMLVDRIDAATYFNRFAELLKDNPPNSVDYPTLHRLERVGFQVGHGFNLAAAPESIRQAFERGLADGRALVLAEGTKAAGIGGKGWVYTLRSGAYGADYLYRAAIAQCCLGENLPQDAVYPALSSDSEGRPLDGNSRYVLRFEKGKLPPVDAFWSLTAYDMEGYLIPNVLKRQAIGDRDNLVANPDGSLDLYIQADSPGQEKEANWLPIAKAPFTLLMRLYSPRTEFLEGRWSPPPVARQ
ncbi:DUF1254 domain-containing protein [Bradyrhizobium sp. LHD-71]|uniref:DUF1254 domain-containing protein n=1 Tax=Bradyrhizobium sp. LHD-71 TaxID=3072141 RepID=UPI00280F5722|nr:DUF1254 domain-containing protein [Bradyrhizobium sp. LHD-71]MDQ8730006.1 DUF1254 domain-containing protein [Bradyrhizobium sp. LHD-71]